MQHRPTPIEELQVIDRLEIGRARVEPRRLIAAYRVTRGQEVFETELTYRFEEDVFDTPAQRGESQNLADLIAVQPALNYGLFCKRISLAGAFDRHDRRMLTEVAANTAREVYVNKLLADNPFLVEPATTVELRKRESYLLANLEFEPAEQEQLPARRSPWASGADRYAVLSSGGKESLLSFALLRELGYRTDPIFINESGRHWFTALNAHRHFSRHVNRTTRVWTDVDRLFSWMLKRLPFVRTDSGRVRADIYPIRLWTVATFLFGALPLVRRRGLGHIVLGCEHDTTRRAVFHGIPHYGGLYDQSRYFDWAMTRYFRRKGWGLVQLSLLRPLSELLIEKVLVERYPDLQREQVSCHAAHTEGERVRPCGRCEKCRRVVALLTVLDADPQRCGYDRGQIDACLAALPDTGMHTERPVTQHLAFELQRRELLDAGHIGEVRARQRVEVLKLRFDADRAPFDGVPAGLRPPLYRLLLEHATGALRRSGRRWVEFDPLSDPALHAPFPLRAPDDASSSERPTDGYLLGEMTWPQARARLQQVDIALLPVGAIEQHGPHLPLDTDAFDADYLARRVAESCSLPRPIVLPPIAYGVSYHHDGFAGTVSISPDTLSRMVYEIGINIARQGIVKLVIINGHGGNVPALNFAAQLINRDARIFTCVESGETSDTDIDALTETPNDVHAGEIETSTTLAVRPELVNRDAARSSVPAFSSRYLDFTSKRGVTWYAYTERLSEDGTMGDPTKATAAKGERIWALMIEHLGRFVEELKPLSLDEIYQRRY